METTQAYYLTKIKDDLSLKQRQNPHYSLRAYARDVGVHPATLSQIIKGKRSLPLKDSAGVISKLNLGPKERTLFIESLVKSKIALDQIKLERPEDRFMLDESYFKSIAEWEHFAVLELFHFKDFKGLASEIVTLLGITENRADVVVTNLLTCGLLRQRADQTLEKTYADVRTTEDVSSQALKNAHKETLELGLNKLEEIEVELRDFSSSTLAINPQKLPEAKAIIREFRQKMAALLRDGHETEVYQLAIQLYPLTPTKKYKN